MNTPPVQNRPSYVEWPGIYSMNPEITIEAIIEAVSKNMDVTLIQMQSKTRVREICEARFIAIHFIRKYTSLSLKKIGAIFGDRNHASILHALEVIGDLMITSPAVKMKVFNVENYLRTNGTLGLISKN